MLSGHLTGREYIASALAGVLLALGLFCAMYFAVTYETEGDKARSAAYEASIAEWKGATVVKICRDGTHIVRGKLGRFKTAGAFGLIVEDPQTVCDGA